MGPIIWWSGPQSPEKMKWLTKTVEKPKTPEEINQLAKKTLEIAKKKKLNQPEIVKKIEALPGKTELETKLLQTLEKTIGDLDKKLSALELVLEGKNGAKKNAESEKVETEEGNKKSEKSKENVEGFQNFSMRKRMSKIATILRNDNKFIDTPLSEFLGKIWNKLAVHESLSDSEKKIFAMVQNLKNPNDLTDLKTLFDDIKKSDEFKKVKKDEKIKSMDSAIEEIKEAEDFEKNYKKRKAEIEKIPDKEKREKAMDLLEKDKIYYHNYLKNRLQHDKEEMKEKVKWDKDLEQKYNKMDKRLEHLNKINKKIDTLSQKSANDNPALFETNLYLINKLSETDFQKVLKHFASKNKKIPAKNINTWYLEKYILDKNVSISRFSVSSIPASVIKNSLSLLVNKMMNESDFVQAGSTMNNNIWKISNDFRSLLGRAMDLNIGSEKMAQAVKQIEGLFEKKWKSFNTPYTIQMYAGTVFSLKAKKILEQRKQKLKKAREKTKTNRDNQKKPIFSTDESKNIHTTEGNDSKNSKKWIISVDENIKNISEKTEKKDEKVSTSKQNSSVNNADLYNEDIESIFNNTIEKLKNWELYDVSRWEIIGDEDRSIIIGFLTDFYGKNPSNHKYDDIVVDLLKRKIPLITHDLTFLPNKSQKIYMQIAKQFEWSSLSSIPDKFLKEQSFIDIITSKEKDFALSHIKDYFSDRLMKINDLNTFLAYYEWFSKKFPSESTESLLKTLWGKDIKDNQILQEMFLQTTENHKFDALHSELLPIIMEDAAEIGEGFTVIQESIDKKNKIKNNEEEVKKDVGQDLISSIRKMKLNGESEIINQVNKMDLRNHKEIGNLYILIKKYNPKNPKKIWSNILTVLKEENKKKLDEAKNKFPKDELLKLDDKFKTKWEVDDEKIKKVYIEELKIAREKAKKEQWYKKEEFKKQFQKDFCAKYGKNLSEKAREIFESIVSYTQVDKSIDDTLQNKNLAIYLAESNFSSIYDFDELVEMKQSGQLKINSQTGKLELSNNPHILDSTKTFPSIKSIAEVPVGTEIALNQITSFKWRKSLEGVKVTKTEDEQFDVFNQGEKVTTTHLEKLRGYAPTIAIFNQVTKGFASKYIDAILPKIAKHNNKTAGIETGQVTESEAKDIIGTFAQLLGVEGVDRSQGVWQSLAKFKNIPKAEVEEKMFALQSPTHWDVFSRDGKFNELAFDEILNPPKTDHSPKSQTA